MHFHFFHFYGMGIKVSHKAELIQRLIGNGQQIRSFGIERISVFGSFARDTKITPLSDIDFVLDFIPAQKNFDNLVDLGDYLEDLLGRKVELLTHESLKSDTGKHILATSQEVAI